jgi:hypothetical protein
VGPKKVKLRWVCVALLLLAVPVVELLRGWHPRTWQGRLRLQWRQLSEAIESYHETFDTYPPDAGYGLDPAKSPGTYDAGSLWRYLAQPVIDPATGEKVGPFLEEWQEEFVEAYDDPKHGPSFRLTDPWGSPFGFVGDPKRVIHNPGSFDLFSVGPDCVTACNNGIDDDSMSRVEGDGVTDCSRDPRSRYAADNRAYNRRDDDGNGVVDDAPEFGPEASRNGDIGDDINNWSMR